MLTPGERPRPRITSVSWRAAPQGAHRHRRCREDVNVSVSGGTRVEIKGVAISPGSPSWCTTRPSARRLCWRSRRAAGSASLTRRLEDRAAAAAGRGPRRGASQLKEARKNDLCCGRSTCPASGHPLLLHPAGQVVRRRTLDRLKVIACWKSPTCSTPRRWPRRRRDSVATAAQGLKAGDEDAQLLFWRLDDVKTPWRRSRSAAAWPFRASPTRRAKGCPTAPPSSSASCPDPTHVPRYRLGAIPVEET